MQKLTIALISGGISSEREVSLKSAEEVYKFLDKNKYNILRYDPKTDILKLVQDSKKIDAALIIMHGIYGEDGTIQGLLDLLGIPYQGTGVLGSAIAMDKQISKTIYKSAGLTVPEYKIINRNEAFNSEDCINQIGLPIVLKPLRGGSSIGMSIIKSDNELSSSLSNSFQYDKTVLLEQYISGIEITCGVLGNDEPFALPLVEIIPEKEYTFFDYEAKYKPGATKEICPARIDEKLTLKAQEYALIAHKVLNLRGYSRTDMIIKDNIIYVLESNTIPGMTSTSLLPQAAQVAGINFSKLLDLLIEWSLEI